MKKQSKPGDIYKKARKNALGKVKDSIKLAGQMGKAFVKNATGRDSGALVKNKKKGKKMSRKKHKKMGCKQCA